MDNYKGLKRTVAPATPVITTADAKTFLRVDGSDEDTQIDLWVDSATRQIEGFLRRALITQTWRLKLDRFGRHSLDSQLNRLGPGVHNIPRSVISGQDFIQLARMPIQSITSITTYDTDDSSSVFSSSNYGLDTDNGRVYLNSGSVWPTALRDHNAIEIVYVAGYGDAATDIPSPIRQGIYAQLAKIYETRGKCATVCEDIKKDLAEFKIIDYLGFYGND